MHRFMSKSSFVSTALSKHISKIPLYLKADFLNQIRTGVRLMYTKPGFLQRYWIWLVLIVVFIVVAFFGLDIMLNWSILQEMYHQKAGIDWFNTVFYHNYTFLLAAVFAFLTLNPVVGHSDLYGIWESIRWLSAVMSGRTEQTLPTLSLKTRKTIWVFWQLIKWMVAFSVFVSLNGIPFIGRVTPTYCMVLFGIGNWSLVPRIFSLPIMPASDSEMISLMPTMEAQYRLLYLVSTTILFIIAVRMAAKLIKDFVRQERNIWIRDLFVILTCIVTGIILGSPYWIMDITTPFDYLICLVLLIAFFTASLFFHFMGFGRALSFAARKRMIFMAFALIVIGVLVVNAILIAGFRLNWNNNWVQYEWNPLTEKQIAVTRWSAGIDGIQAHTVENVPTGNVTKVVSLVRQWDKTAAYTKMRNQIGVNWMGLADSDILYINGREYWAAPTTIVYPSQDWISTHLIYTHTSKIIVVDSHSGEFVPPSEAFGVQSEPLIYYGEGFSTNVYVNVKGFSEIGNVSYQGDPDYVLSGWQRTLWFLLEGQMGFAFTPPQENINMLYNRDVLERVKSILIYGLTVDPDAYLVSDGNKVYYAMQVYVDYPMHSGFSVSPYLRFFAVVLVDLEDGSMHGYVVDNPDGFLVDFYKDYYSSWEALPDWLIPQLRYPEALLGMHGLPGQLDVDFLFHVGDPFVWRSGSQFYERPEATEVLYVLMTVENQPYFIGLQLVEFQASPGRNLAGLYVSYGGSQLGRIDLYSVPNATTQFIGPSAALQAFETDDYVRTQLTLLTSRRFGNILLYSIGDQLYYFIPVYIEAEIANAVITKMAFIGVIDAATGTKVATGADSAQAYYALVGITPSQQTGAEARLQKIMGVFEDREFSIAEPTKIGGDIWIRVDNLTYVNENQWSQTESAIDQFIQDYVQGHGNEIYYWSQDNNTANFGVLYSEEGIVKLYYLSISYK
jgi:hypothetical protein